MRPKNLRTLGMLLIAMFLAAKANAQALTAAFSADDTLVCVGVDVNFTDLSSGGTGPYTWSWDFGDSNTSTNQNPTHSYSAGGKYAVTLTVTDALLNTSSKTDTICVIQAQVITSLIRVCSPVSSATLIAADPISNGVSGYWFSAGSAILADPTNDTTLVTNLANGLNVFFWVLSDGFCSDADQAAIYKDVPVVANAGQDQQICNSSPTATLNGNNPAPGTGLWTTTSTATITSPTIRNSTVSGLNTAGNYDFVWTITNGACVTTDTIRIVVFNYIAANAGTDQQVCASPGTTSVTGNTPASGTVLWTTTGSAIIANPTSTTTNISGLTTAGVQTFIYTITNGACVSRDTLLITVSALKVSNAGNDLQVCSSSPTATLNGNNPAPGTGLWTTTSTAVITTPASATTGVTGLNVAGNYYFVWTITNGACVSRDTMVVIVKNPVMVNAGADQSYCNATTATLNGSHPAPGTGLWTTTGTATITSPAIKNSTVSNLSVGDNYFIWTVSYGACVTRDTVMIHIDQLFTSNAGPDQQICQTSSSSTLAGNSPMTGTGTWSTTSSAVITVPTDSNTTVTGLTVGTYQFVWTIVNGLCTSSDTMQIIVNPLDTSHAGPDQSVCSAPGTTTLAATTPLIGTGLWTTTSSASITTPSSPISGVTGLTSAGVNNFVWTVTNGACVSRDTVAITVFLAQIANAGPDQQICSTTSTATLAGNAPTAGTGTWSTTSSATITAINNPASTVTGLTPGNFDFVWTISNGSCLSRDTIRIKVSALDTAHAGIDQSICSAPGTTTLAATTPLTGTGAWTTTSSASITTPSNPTSGVTGLTSAGLFNFIWTVTNGACISRDTAVITVALAQIANAGPDQQLCETTTSTSLAANAVTAGTGTWTTTSAATITAINNPSTTVTGLVSGTFDFVWTISNGSCLSRDTIRVTVSTLITADAGVDQQICSSPGTTNLSGNDPAPGTGLWTTTSAAIIVDPTDPNTAISGLTSVGSYEFIWTITNGACITTDTMVVNVDANEIADAGIDQSICITNPIVQLNATPPGAGMGVWISLGSGSPDNPLDPASTVSGATVGVNSFVWMVSNGVCLTMDTTDIVIYDYIVADAGGDQAICASTGTITLAGNDPSPGTGTWTTNSGGSITSPSSPTSTVTGLNTAGVYEFYWTIDNGPCSSVDTMVLSIDAAITANAGSDHSICSSLSSNDTLYGNSPLPGTSLWTTVSSAIISIPTDSITAVSGLSTGNYQFVYTITNGLCSSTDSITITADTIIPADAGMDQQICASPGITLISGSDPSPGTSFWFTTSSATIDSIASPNATVSGLNSAGNYDFIYTTVNGVCLNSDTMTIAVDDSTIPNAGPDQYLCESTTFTNLAATPASIGTGFWISSSPATLVDPLDPASLVTGLTVGTHEFVWLINNGMCLNSDTVYIYVDSAATTATAGSDVVICASLDSVQLSGNTPITGIGSWSTTGSATITNPSDTNAVVSGLSVGNNEFIWTIANGACSSSDTVIINVLPLPVVDAGADVFTTNGTPVTIGGSPSASGGNQPYTYLWTPGSILNDSLAANPVATTTSTIALALTVTDSLGCSVSDTMVIYVNDPPVATDDTLTILEDSIAVINILLNDSDVNNNIDTASIGILTGPYFGSVSIDTINGTVTYTPNSNYNGTDSLQYSICDQGLPVYCDTAWIYINILPVNDPPIAVDDYYLTPEDSCIQLNALANDIDVENDLNLASFSVLVMPTHGTITFDTIPGVMTYCPDSAFNGNDTLQYVICDNGNPVYCDTAIVVISVSPFDNAPVAVDDTVSICSGGSSSIDVLLNDYDQEGDTVTLSIISSTANGTVLITGNTISYTPFGTFAGLDSIQYAICENINPGLCDSAWVWITVHSLPVLSTTHINPLCSTDSIGAIDLTVTGTSPFTYIWSNTDTTEDIDSLIAGTYTVVVTDSFGCSSTLTDSVGPPSPLIASSVISHIKCYNDSTGSIDLTVTGGTMPYAFNWSNGELTEDIDSLFAGVYTVNITDSNGCFIQQIDTLVQPSAAISVASIVTGVYCAGDSSGSIDITVNGGTPGYTFLWNNGGTNEDLGAIIAGNYTVTVTDTNSCVFTYIDSVTSTIAPVVITYVSTDAQCINNIFGTIDVTTTGGTLPFTYSWSNTDTTEDISNLIAGNYILTLTDSFNCVYSQSVNILDSSAVIISAADTILCKGDSIQLVAPVNNFVTYQWLNGTDTIAAGTNATLVVDSAGSYTVIASATCGTYTSNAIDITVNALPSVNVSSPITTVCDSSVTLQASGGITYSWTPAATLDSANIAQPLATPLITTHYIVTVTDSNGCSATASVDVTVDCDSLAIPTGFSPNGDGYNDFFNIGDIQNYPGNRLRIFNRWGNMVYDKTNYDNSWNGAANVNLVLQGQYVPEGTYYYVLDLNNNSDFKTGFIILKR